MYHNTQDLQAMQHHTSLPIVSICLLDSLPVKQYYTRGFPDCFEDIVAIKLEVMAAQRVLCGERERRASALAGKALRHVLWWKAPGDLMHHTAGPD